MNTKLITIIILGIVIIGGVSFYGGIKYSGSKSPFNQRMGESRFAGGDGVNMHGSQGTETNVVVGEIIAKDDTSITIKLPDGGSRIVFFTQSTVIAKNATTSAADLVIGENVVANGSANADGSTNAETIQLGSGMPRSEENQSSPQE